MHEKKPSGTALGAAVYRAAHQTVEGGAIFADLAHAILGAVRYLVPAWSGPRRRRDRMS
jgi:hypothetical protein